MSESEKAAKLAAARKKLKKFQQRGRSASPSQRNLPDLAENKQSLEPITTKEEEDALKANELKVPQDDESSLVVTFNGSAAAVDEKSNPAAQEWRQQLDAYSSTISLLVSEKNELQDLVTELRAEITRLREELGEREVGLEKLSHDNTSLSDANRDLSDKLSEMGRKIEYLEGLSRDVEEDDGVKQENEDLKEELSQLQVRMSLQIEEMKKLQELNDHFKSQIEILEINLQQLKSAGPPTVDQSIEKLTKENERITEECSSYKEQVAKIATERDVLSQQYQQYILRLNGQLRTLTSQVENLAGEKRNMEAALSLNREQISELEALLTKLKEERDLLQSQYSSLSKEANILQQQPAKSADNEALLKTIEELKKSKAGLVVDNEQLSELILEKENRLQEMQIRIERLESEIRTAQIGNGQEGSVDREKLVQAMQSDKLAASRAIAQNRQLKSQLQELEKAFIALSNDKLQLTEQLQAAQFSSREATEKLAVLEPEVIKLREEVAKLAEQRDVTIYWQRELEEAHERIQALTHQNNELKKRVIWNLGNYQRANSHSEKSDHHHHHHHDDHSGHSHNHDHDHDGCTGHHHAEAAEQSEFPWAEFEKVKFTLGQLEGRFERAMEDIARLNDEKQKLEHLVLQLQSETETIGEYVTLYQIQRGVLRQRAHELTVARDNLKQHLTELAQLMVRLVPQLRAQPVWNQLTQSGDVSTDSPVPENDDAVSRMTDLLKMIHASNLVTAQDNSLQDVFHFEEDNTKHSPENFHPCHVCSGRLIDV